MNDTVKVQVAGREENAMPTEIVDYLVFANYAHNRTIAPHITPERWKRVYGAAAVERMEPLYQASAGVVA